MGFPAKTLRYVCQSFFHALPFVVAGSLLTGCTRDTVYPGRPITLICPWSAGGGTDTVSRQIAVLLEKELGVPVNVVNATGGAGVTGHTRGALARPDGYTITMATVELNMLRWRGLTSISPRDFRPVVLLNEDAAALFVRDEAPWNTAGELADHIRSDPGRLNASGTAQGGIWHLALAGWLQAAGLKPVDVKWISINGAAPSLQELMAGGVQLVCCSLPEAKALLEAGRIRCLGLMAEERLEQFPDVPTFKELGIEWGVATWRGIVLPAGTPDVIAEKAGAALDKVVNGDEFRQFMRSAGFNWSFQGPDEFRGSLDRMDRQFGELLTSDAFRSMGKRHVGPMFFPALLAVVGAAALIGLLTSGGLKTKEGAAGIPRQGMLRLIEALAWVAAYIVLAEWTGFILTAGVLLLLMMARMGARWPVALTVCVLLVPALYQVFAVVLRVPLPRGWVYW